MPNNPVSDRLDSNEDSLANRFDAKLHLFEYLRARRTMDFGIGFLSNNVMLRSGFFSCRIVPYGHDDGDDFSHPLGTPIR